MNKNYPIYKTTFIDDMRSLVEEAAQNFKENTAISYKENYWDKEEGWIYITGRKKNLIILSNGKNVYPEEIEADIQKVEGVSEVVVYAGESRVQKDRITMVAEIFPDADLLADKGITDLQTYFEEQVKALNARMAPYKAVKQVKIRDVEFRKNTSRKITRFNIDKTID